MERFNQRGPADLVIPSRRGRKPTYHAEERAQVLQEVQRQPNRQRDQTATWSLKLLERALRKEALPHIGATTVGRILHEEDYSVQRNRIWCETGSTACAILMLRKKSLIERAFQLAEACGIPLWNQDEADLYAIRPQPGGSWQPRVNRHSVAA